MKFAIVSFQSVSMGRHTIQRNAGYICVVSVTGFD